MNPLSLGRGTNLYRLRGADSSFKYINYPSFNFFTWAVAVFSRDYRLDLKHAMSSFSFYRTLSIIPRTRFVYSVPKIITFQIDAARLYTTDTL